MRIVFLLVASLMTFALHSEKKCFIGISSSDCQLCLVSYQFINKIDRRLNPQLVLSKVDQGSAEYFVKEFLKINDIPWVIDDKKYNELLTDQFSLQVKLYDDTALIYQFPVKELSYRFEDLNNFAADASEDKIKPFSAGNLDLINKIIKKKFWGTTKKFIIREYLILHSELTKWVIFSNLKYNTCDSLHLNDSFLLNLTYDEKTLRDIKEKRDYYLDDIGNIHESSVHEVGYYNDHIYIYYSVLDYPLLKSKEEILRSGNKAVLYYRHYLAELDTRNGKRLKTRILNLTEDNNNYRINVHFDIAENQPALFFRKREKTDTIEYMLLNQEWVKKVSQQVKPEFMAVAFGENKYYNQYCINYDQNFLIDNAMKSHVKIHPGTLETGILTGGAGGLMPYHNKVYLNVVSRPESKQWVYKIDMSTQKIEVIKTFNYMNVYPFAPMFYLEQCTDTLFVLDINDDKQLCIVDAIKL